MSENPLPHGEPTAVPQPLDLEPIRKRCKRATPGPWLYERLEIHERARMADGPTHMHDVLEAGHSKSGAFGKHGHYICGFASTRGKYKREEDNALFVAHAREDVPALIAEIERLQSLLPVSPPPQRAPESVRLALDALESDATLKMRQEAFARLRDEFYPIDGPPHGTAVPASQPPPMDANRLDAAVAMLETLQRDGYYLHGAQGRALDRDQFVAAVTQALSEVSPLPVSPPPQPTQDWTAIQLARIEGAVRVSGDEEELIARYLEFRGYPDVAQEVRDGKYFDDAAEKRAEAEVVSPPPTQEPEIGVPLVRAVYHPSEPSTSGVLSSSIQPRTERLIALAVKLQKAEHDRATYHVQWQQSGDDGYHGTRDPEFDSWKFEKCIHPDCVLVRASLQTPASAVSPTQPADEVRCKSCGCQRWEHDAQYRQTSQACLCMSCTGYVESSAVSPREEPNMRQQLRRFARDLRRESALWPKNERAQQVARMLNTYAEHLDVMASVPLSPASQEIQRVADNVLHDHMPPDAFKEAAERLARHVLAHSPEGQEIGDSVEQCRPGIVHWWNSGSERCRCGAYSLSPTQAPLQELIASWRALAVKEAMDSRLRERSLVHGVCANQLEAEVSAAPSDDVIQQLRVIVQTDQSDSDCVTAIENWLDAQLSPGSPHRPTMSPLNVRQRLRFAIQVGAMNKDLLTAALEEIERLGSAHPPTSEAFPLSRIANIKSLLKDVDRCQHYGAGPHCTCDESEIHDAVALIRELLGSPEPPTSEEMLDRKPPICNVCDKPFLHELVCEDCLEHRGYVRKVSPHPPTSEPPEIVEIIRSARCSWCGYAYSAPRGDCQTCAPIVAALKKWTNR